MNILDPQDTVAFRRVLGSFGTGLVIVAANINGHNVGFTCQSFTSVSLDPPLVAFFSRVENGSWHGIREAGKFCVSVLSEHQENTARIFATRGVDKFKAVEIEQSPNGSPIIKGSIAWIDCHIDQVFSAGDHDGVIGRIDKLAHVDDAYPLMYFRGGYGTFHS